MLKAQPTERPICKIKVHDFVIMKNTSGSTKNHLYWRCDDIFIVKYVQKNHVAISSLTPRYVESEEYMVHANLLKKVQPFRMINTKNNEDAKTEELEKRFIKFQN